MLERAEGALSENDNVIHVAFGQGGGRIAPQRPIGADSIGNDPKLALAVQHQAAHFLWTGLFEEKAEVIDGYTRH